MAEGPLSFTAQPAPTPTYGCTRPDQGLSPTVSSGSSSTLLSGTENPATLTDRTSENAGSDAVR